MTRAPWTRWTPGEDAEVRLHASDLTADEIAQKLNRTVEQVRGRAKRIGVSLTLQRWGRRRLNDRISASVLIAWSDPDKRSRMMDGRAGELGEKAA